MKVILSVIAGVLFAASIIIPRRINASRLERADYHGDDVFVPVKKSFTVAGIILALLLLVFVNSFVIIPTGYTGVRTTFGQIDQQPVQNGFNWKLPFIQSVEKVNNKQQDIKFEKTRVWSETSARTAIFYEDVTVTYTINPEYSAWIYAHVSSYRQALINESIVASSIKASSKGLSDSDATNRSIIEPLCMENLQRALNEKYGADVVLINKVIIGNADFEDSYNAAIAAKQQAQLEAEKQSIENKRAIEKADADAIVRRTTANAQAEARLIEAEAEAEANKLLEKSLTEQILREMWIEKWDGTMPRFVSGDSGTVMFGIDTGE